MPTIKAGPGPKSRTEVGNAVLEAAATTDTRAIKGRLAAFEKAHRAYVAAHEKVRKAEEALRRQQAEVGERDGEQDEAVNALASALAGDGLPRTNPFRPLGFEAPSVIIKMGYGDEAKVVTNLAKKAGSHAGASKATQAAARRAATAAESVRKALAPIPTLETAWSAAITQREALSQPWETTLAALKRGARAAEDDGSRGLYATLFESTARPPTRPRKKPSPATTPSPPT